MSAAIPGATLAMMELRCLIVDDNANFLALARDLLEAQGVAVVGLASTIDEALRRAEELRPDVTLVDIELGGEDGFELASRLVEQSDGRPSRVILVSTYSEEDFADLIATSPAAGFLSKSSLSASAIERVLNGPRGT